MRPDYTTLREATPFRWSVGATAYALMELTGTPLHAYNLEADACIDMYRRGWPLFRERFPDSAIPLPRIHTPPISYGHVNGLGCELRFPEGGEVCMTPLCDSLEATIAAVRREVDWARAGMAPFYLDFRERLRQAFPERAVGFTYGLEGPITTVYELRGQDVLLDLMDRPALTAELLAATVRSLASFWRFFADVNGFPHRSAAAGMCDDVAAMVPPRLFPELVLPAWEGVYAFRTTGTRSAHVEDLTAAQLCFLEAAGLSYFDPGISPKLTPPLIRDGCRVPFGWRLGSFHYLTMECGDVRDWVFQAAADGATCVFTHIEGIMSREEQAPKVLAFAAAAREVQQRLDAGATRADLRAEVSPAGCRRFWEAWPEG